MKRILCVIRECYVGMLVGLGAAIIFVFAIIKPWVGVVFIGAVLAFVLYFIFWDVKESSC